MMISFFGGFLNFWSLWRLDFPKTQDKGKLYTGLKMSQIFQNVINSRNL